MTLSRQVKYWIETELLSDEELLNNLVVETVIDVRFRRVDWCREVAKRPEVQQLFSIAKYIDRPVFDVRPLEMNMLQKNLLVYIKLYDNINEAFERPPDRIVYDDKSLAKWLEDQSNKTQGRWEENWRKDNQGIGKSALDHQELFELNDSFDPNYVSEDEIQELYGVT